jgi:hypothetical protein
MTSLNTERLQSVKPPQTVVPQPMPKAGRKNQRDDTWADIVILEAKRRSQRLPGILPDTLLVHPQDAMTCRLDFDPLEREASIITLRR